jgi:hypothetical protein
VGFDRDECGCAYREPVEKELGDRSFSRTKARVTADNTLGLIARAIDAERQCCRFLRFRVTVEPDEGPILLELTGPEGTREFLTALMAW